MEMNNRKKEYTLQLNKKSGRYHITVPLNTVQLLGLKEGQKFKWDLHNFREDQTTLKVQFLKE